MTYMIYVSTAHKCKNSWRRNEGVSLIYATSWIILEKVLYSSYEYKWDSKCHKMRFYDACY